MPPPSHVQIHLHYASAFFFATFFGFATTSSAEATAGVPTFFEVALFNIALMAFLLLETPKEPFERFPFFDFLSPLPI